MGNNFYTVKQIATETFVEEERLLELAKSGHAPCVYIDNKIFFKRKVINWIRKNLVQIQDGQSLAKKLVILPPLSLPDNIPPELLAIQKEVGEYRICQLKEVFYPSCVYFLYHRDKLIYIGQSICLPARIKQHWDEHKIFDAVYYIPIPESGLKFLEKELIRKLNPPLNIVNKNNDVLHNNCTVEHERS